MLVMGSARLLRGALGVQGERHNDGLVAAARDKDTRHVVEVNTPPRRASNPRRAVTLHHPNATYPLPL